MNILQQVLEERHVFEYNDLMYQWTCVGVGHPGNGGYCPGCGVIVTDEEMCRLDLPNEALYVTIALAKRRQDTWNSLRVTTIGTKL